MATAPTPAYRLLVGERVVDTTREPRASTVVRLVVELDLDTPADGATLVLGNVDGLKPERGDRVEVDLGYAGDGGGLTRVMSGTVSAVEPDLTTTRVVAHSGASALLRPLAEQTYLNRTAGAIVRDLAAAAGVGVATADDGTTFPAYVVDGRQSAHRHMLDLARLCGFDLYLDPAGKLVFEKFTSGKTVHVYEYAKHVVALDVRRTPPPADVVEAWGEGPGGGRGGDAWAWLTKDFSASKGTAGPGAGGTPGAAPVRLLLERSALRTATGARSAAEAALAAIRHRATRGELVGVGRPEVKLGDAVRLRGLPKSIGGLDGVYQVRGVTHRLGKRAGFTTTVAFQGAESAGAGAGP
ncbi:MAG TPA: hypothetical protein VF880_19105 [Actinomycetes bacterium]